MENDVKFLCARTGLPSTVTSSRSGSTFEPSTLTVFRFDRHAASNDLFGGALRGYAPFREKFCSRTTMEGRQK